MMSGGHAATGVAMGTLVTGVTTVIVEVVTSFHPSPEGVTAQLVLLAVTWIVGALAGGGAALTPDIDHDKSAITASGGLVTRAVAELLQWLARVVHRSTARHHDSPGNGEHRGLLHSWFFAAVIGVVIMVGCWLSPWTGAGVLVVLTSPALRALAWDMPLGPRRARKWRETMWLLRHRFGAAAVSILTVFTLVVVTGGLTNTGPVALFGGWHAAWFGLLVGLGMVTHSAGDSITNSGIPWKFPFAHRCDRCRVRFVARSCWLRRVPWHRCEHCTAARRQWPLCARWDRNIIVPKAWTFSTGTPHGLRKEGRIATASLCLSAACVMASAGFVWLGTVGSV